VSLIEDRRACAATIARSGKIDISMPERAAGRSSPAIMTVLSLLPRIKIGQLDLVLPDGTQHQFKGSIDGPHARLNIHNERVVRRFMTGGKLGFCEAYLDGDWSSPDVTTLFLLFLQNQDVMKPAMMGRAWARIMSFLIHKLRPNSKRGAQKNIYAHYDLGNDFYAAWLDPSMTYSSAYFADGISDLEQAQMRKYEEILQRLGVQKHHHILELGCGWGGFAEYAARKTGSRITGITVSKAQHEYATKRIAAAGLSDLVEIRLQDYRDTTGQFDRIASIEMFEAVGESYWPTFFKQLQGLLKPGGKAVLQIITIRDEDFDNYRRSADFIQRYIFPGGMLPSISILSRHIKRAGLQEGPRLQFGKDYAQTLRLWNDRFISAWPEISYKPRFDERFKRLWKLYLAYCEAGFMAGSIDVIHQTIIKPDSENH
jgi:cyclopropane-fatty-acyl-phospholipid synthase